MKKKRNVIGYEEAISELKKGNVIRRAPKANAYMVIDKECYTIHYKALIKLARNNTLAHIGFNGYTELLGLVGTISL